MEDIYENADFFKRHGKENYNNSTEPETENDIYVKIGQHRNPGKPSASTSFDYKIIISALGLLTVGALTSLCAVQILYHNKAVSTEILSRNYENATATLMMLDKEANETETLYKNLRVKYQQADKQLSACKETETLYENLKVKDQQANKQLSACKETETLYENLTVKYQQADKQLSAYKETETLYENLKVKYQQAHKRLSACEGNQNCKPCKEGWKSLGLKCYYFSTEKLNWTQSRDHCVKKGGHLVIITSETEQNFVSLQIGEIHWIGLNDLETEGEWMWVNNQPLKETGVTFWFRHLDGTTEPDNWKNVDPSGENCAAVNKIKGITHTWFDASCHSLKKMICEN